MGERNKCRGGGEREMREKITSVGKRVLVSLRWSLHTLFVHDYTMPCSSAALQSVLKNYQHSLKSTDNPLIPPLNKDITYDGSPVVFLVDDIDILGQYTIGERGDVLITIYLGQILVNLR